MWMHSCWDCLGTLRLILLLPPPSLTLYLTQLLYFHTWLCLRLHALRSPLLPRQQHLYPHLHPRIMADASGLSLRVIKSENHNVNSCSTWGQKLRKSSFTETAVALMMASSSRKHPQLWIVIFMGVLWSNSTSRAHHFLGCLATTAQNAWPMVPPVPSQFFVVKICTNLNHLDVLHNDSGAQNKRLDDCNVFGSSIDGQTTMKMSYHIMLTRAT
jgi:hypothetical protein